MDNLKNISGVNEIALLPSAGTTKAYRLELVKGADPREAIFRSVVKSGWTLLEMRRDRTSLEEVFRSLTLN